MHWSLPSWRSLHKQRALPFFALSLRDLSQVSRVSSPSLALASLTCFCRAFHECLCQAALLFLGRMSMASESLRVLEHNRSRMARNMLTGYISEEALQALEALEDLEGRAWRYPFPRPLQAELSDHPFRSF